MTETRKLLSLPSGARVKIRRLSSFDLCGLPPEIQQEPGKAANNELVRVILTRCTGAIRFSDSDKRKIVDKPFFDCDLSELSVEELDQADATAIFEAVVKLSAPESAVPEEKA